MGCPEEARRLPHFPIIPQSRPHQVHMTLSVNIGSWVFVQVMSLS